MNKSNANTVVPSDEQSGKQPRRPPSADRATGHRSKRPSNELGENTPATPQNPQAPFPGTDAGRGPVEYDKTMER
jgi:hypothetical protein